MLPSVIFSAATSISTNSPLRTFGAVGRHTYTRLNYRYPQHLCLSKHTFPAKVWRIDHTIHGKFKGSREYLCKRCCLLSISRHSINHYNTTPVAPGVWNFKASIWIAAENYWGECLSVYWYTLNCLPACCVSKWHQLRRAGGILAKTIKCQAIGGGRESGENRRTDHS